MFRIQGDKEEKTQFSCGCCNQINQVTKLSTNIFGVMNSFWLGIYSYISLGPHV